jgi:hypothetical protein
MKKTFITLLTSVTILISCSPNKIGASAATVGNIDWKVTLYHYSKDVVISENGVECKKVSALAGFKKPGYASYESGSARSLLYTNGIQLDKNIESHTNSIEKNGKTVTETYNKKSKPFLDVTTVLGESSDMSFGDLKDEYVKLHSGKKKK